MNILSNDLIIKIAGHLNYWDTLNLILSEPCLNNLWNNVSLWKGKLNYSCDSNNVSILREIYRAVEITSMDAEARILKEDLDFKIKNLNTQMSELENRIKHLNREKEVVTYHVKNKLMRNRSKIMAMADISKNSEKRFKFYILPKTIYNIVKVLGDYDSLERFFNKYLDTKLKSGDLIAIAKAGNNTLIRLWIYIYLNKSGKLRAEAKSGKFEIKLLTLKDLPSVLRRSLTERDIDFSEFLREYQIEIEP